MIRVLPDDNGLPGRAGWTVMDAATAPPTTTPPTSAPPPSAPPGTESDPGTYDPIEARPPYGLYRLRRDGLVGGVCAGLASRLGLRPSVVRIAFVAASALGGIGVIVYLGLWLALPDIDGPATSSRFRTALAIALAVIAAALLLSWVPMPPAELLWPGLLLGVGAALWQPDPRRARWTDAPRAPVSPGTQPLAESAPPTPPPAPPAKPRQPQILGRVTIAAALAAVGAGLLFDRTELFDVAAYQLIAVALLVLGAGLVVGAFLGRARWLLLLAAPLVLVLPVAGTFATLDVDPLHHLGDRLWIAPTAASVEPLYENGTGRAELVIGDGAVVGGEPDATAGATTIRNGIGSIDIIVPAGMEVRLDARAGWGTIRVIDQRVDVVETPDGDVPLSSRHEVVYRQGRDATLDHVLAGDPGGGTLTVEAVIGFGDIEVTRLAPLVPEEGR
jgi:phage shock protein PspC (stress-responsive transcriptional regulator)